MFYIIFRQEPAKKQAKHPFEVDELSKRMIAVVTLFLLAILAIHPVALAAVQIGVGAQLKNEQFDNTVAMNWWLTDNWALRGDYSWNTEELGIAALYEINPGSNAALYIGVAKNDLFTNETPDPKASRTGAQLIAEMEWNLSRIKPGLSLMAEAQIDPGDLLNQSVVDNEPVSKFSITINYRFLSPNIAANTYDPNTARLLAKLIMLEANDEPFEGQVAVAAVVLNRTHDSRFPDSVAKVIYQAGQFSTARKIAGIVPDESALNAANTALRGNDPSHGALYFYNPATASKSARHYIKKARFQVTARIGHHVFMK